VFSNTGALLTILSCARNRLGYYLHPRDMRAHGVYTHMVYFNRNAPIAEVYLQAARSLGIAALPATLVAPRVDEADRTSLQKIMRDGGMADPAAGYLVFNPNASELRRERLWPEASFATLITRLHHARPELALCIVGGPGEEAIGAEVARQTGLSGLCDLSGRLTPGELAALLQGARAFVTNDSGPMHLALALDTPTVALFGPVSPDHYGGTANNQRLINLSHRVYCSPCVHHFLEPPCHGDNQCMKLITVDEVWQAVETLLSGAAWTTDTRELHYQAPGVVFGVQHRKNRTE
jgi:ADP-heptose:LPS heptosyltransferase